MVINSDIVLYDDFPEALAFLDSNFDEYFMIGSRYDSYQLSRDIPTLSELGRPWLLSLRTKTLVTGKLHTYGKSDVTVS